MSEENLTVERVELSRVVPGKNPRKRFDADRVNELAASIRTQGIIQPLLVRPSICIGKTAEELETLKNDAPKLKEIILHAGNGETTFELIAGERRWRAAKQEKLPTVPVIARLLSDREAMELHLIEQLQHDDWTPVEEAESYRMLLELRDEAGNAVYSGETLAAKIGKTRQYIYQRLKLLHLPKLAREALDAGDISEEVARLIGGIPNAELREKAAQEIVKPPLQIGAMNRAQTRQHISLYYVKALAKAPFSLDDPTLVPLITDEDGERVGGLACTDCPMRITQRGGDICTNPRCYSAKADEIWRRSEAGRADEKQSGDTAEQKFLSEEECRQIFTPEGKVHPLSDYVELGRRPASSEVKPGLKEIPRWRDMVAGPNAKAETVLARNDHGKVFELAERKLAVIAAAKNGFDVFAKASSGTELYTNKELRDKKRKESEKSKQEFAAAQEAMGEVVFAIDALILDEPLFGQVFRDVPLFPKLLSALVDLALAHAGHDGRWMVAKRYGMAEPWEESLKLFAHQLTPESRLGFIVELLLGQGFRYQGTANADFKVFAELLGVRAGSGPDSRNADSPKKGKKAEKLDGKGPPKAELPALPKANETREHEFEKITRTKYRCNGCGAAAVKYQGKIIVEKARRGKACDGNLAPAKIDRKKRGTVAKPPKIKTKRRLRQSRAKK